MSNKKPFRFHWGHGIVLTFLAFAAFMSYFYLRMSNEKVELVSENYFEEGQKFDQIKRLKQDSIQRIKIRNDSLKRAQP